MRYISDALVISTKKDSDGEIGIPGYAVAPYVKYDAVLVGAETFFKILGP